MSITRHLKSLTSIALILASSLVVAEDKALLVGVSNYPHLPKLPGIQHDLNNMQKVVKRLGFAPNQIKTLHNQTATTQNVKRELSQWLTDTDQDDRVFIYFSAHGVPVPDLNQDETDGLDESIALFDSKIIDIDQNQQSVTNVLTDDTLGELIAQIPSQQIYLIVDACHSRSVTRSINNTHGYFAKTFNYKLKNQPTQATTTNIESNNYIQITAARDDQKALATFNGSVVTNAIAEFVLNHPNPSLITPYSLYIAAQKAAQSIEQIDLRYSPDYFTLNADLLNHAITQPLISTKQIRSNITTNSKALIQSWIRASQQNVVTIKINQQPIKQLSLYEGQRFDLSINLKQPSQLLLLNVDQLNNISVLYPADLNELIAVKQELSIADDILVGEPFGTDTLIAIAFLTEVDLNGFINQQFKLKQQDTKLQLLNQLIANNPTAINWVELKSQPSSERQTQWQNNRQQRRKDK